MPRDKQDAWEDALFERLYEALGEEAVDPNSLRSSLSDAGVNVEKTLRDGKQLFAAFHAQQRLANAREKLERARQLMSSAKTMAAESIERVRDEIARVLAGDDHGTRYLAFHRQLQSIEKQDLESLGDDAAWLDLVERLEAGEQDE